MIQNVSLGQEPEGNHIQIPDLSVASLKISSVRQEHMFSHTSTVYFPGP